MSVGIDKLASELQKVIEEKDKNKKTPYDTEAEVVRVDTEVVWVKIPGGVDETPVQKTVNAKVGDTVQVRVSGGRAFLVGNGTNPPTDDTVANVAMDNARDANQNAAAAGMAAEQAIESANQANEKAIEATEFATQAKTQAGEATEAANEAKAQASAATTAANQAKTQAAEAETAANEAKTSAAEATTAANEAKTQASEATTAANQAKDDAAKANTAANGAVTSLGIVQGVVDGLSVDMDEMQTHVAMMDAVVDPDSGKTLVPAGLHVVPTNNGYFVVLSNDGMYVYDNESDLVAIFGENIKFDSIRPQRIGGDDAYIEYYDSNHDGKADSLRIVGANISSSTGIPTKVSELQNDSGYTTKTYVDDAVGDTATDLANYILSNDKAIDDLERQIDGAIDTWYYAGDPTTSNEPAKDWTTEALKESHLRDLYFNTSNGHTFRWAKEGNTYKWIQIEDADAIKALADAAKAQTTADVKKRVFIAQPTPPYDVGDLWVGGSNGDIKKCKKAKTESQSYAASDWELASKYTDDSSLNSYKTEVGNTYSTKVEVQQTKSTLEGKITAAETSSKSYADGLIEQEVSDRNTAIQASADGITTSVSQNYTKTVDLANTDAVKAAKKAGTDAQSALNTYKTTNDAAVAAAKKAGDDAQADLDDYKDTVQETYATKTQLTQTESSIKSEVSSTYATKSSVPTKVSQLTNDSKYATQTQAQGYANTAESNAKADATTKANAAEANAKADATTKANAAEANAKADTTEKLKSYSTTTQMNSAIEQKANSIALSVSEEKIAELISTKEVSGSIVHVEDASEYPALDCKISLEPIQDLNGYDKPWVGGAGVNLFPYLNARTATFNGVTFSCDGKGTLTMQGTATANDYGSLTFPQAFVIPDGADYKFCMLNTEAHADGVLRFVNGSTIVDSWSPSPVNRETTYAGMSGKTVTGIRLYCAQGETYNLTMKPMFVPKSTAVTGYIPYSNVCPISGRTEVATQRTGKNLLDARYKTTTAQNNVRYYRIGGGGIRLYAGVTYTLSVSEDNTRPNGVYLNEYNPNASTRETYARAYSSYSVTYTPTKDVVIETDCFYSTAPPEGIKNIDVQLEVGNTATAYEPYQGTTYTTSLGRTVYGGTLDVVSGVLTVDKIFVETTWGNFQANVDLGNYSRRRCNFSLMYDVSKITRESICNISPYATGWTTDNLHFYFDTTTSFPRAWLYLPKGTADSTIVQIVYPLATPQTYQLTPRQVELLAGTNNVWSDSGDTYLKYITMNSDMLSLMDKSNADLSRAKAEIKVTTDGISSEVAKKVGDSEIISKINQSAETVQIEAEKIEFNGSVVFNAIKSQTDAAYDTKGSASEASKIATSYITDIDSKNGITIKAVNGTISGSNTDTQNYIKLNADGLDIYKGGKSVAMYGDTARLGEATSARLTLGPEGLGLYDTNSVRYFNIESSVGATNTYVDRKITDVSGGTGAVTTDLSSDASVADIWSNLATGAEFFIRIAWFYYNSSGACIATKESGDSFKKGTTKTSNSYVKYTKPNTLAFTASYPSVSGASTVIRMAHLEVEYSLFGPVYQFCNNPTSSNGAYCFMTGNGVQTNYDYQTAVGRYNDPDFVDDGPEDYRGLFFVGGGASDAYRKNAMVVTHSDDPDGYGSDILIGLDTDICNNDNEIAGYLSDLGWDLEVLIDK